MKCTFSNVFGDFLVNWSTRPAMIYQITVELLPEHYNLRAKLECCHNLPVTGLRAEAVQASCRHAPSCSQPNAAAIGRLPYTGGGIISTTGFVHED